VVEPLAFDLDNTHWLQDLVLKKVNHSDNSFALKLRGLICFSAAVTEMHLKCDNGYRILLRDAHGKEMHLDDWQDAVTMDLAFQVTAQPGCYEIEIDYCNLTGGANFDLWSTSGEISFYPDEITGPKPAASP
jgi:hypothetical protein